MEAEKLRPGVDYIGVTTPFYCHDGEGNFLLHKRSANTRDEQGRWDPGSGQLDFGLEVEQNVLKEVEEEYGCQGEVQESLPPHSIHREQNGKQTHWVAMPFFVRVSRDEVKNNEPHKIEEIGWFPCGEWPEPLHTGFAYTYDHYRDQFEKYRRDGL